jgi:hypothetical protein
MQMGWLADFGSPEELSKCSMRDENMLFQIFKKQEVFFKVDGKIKIGGAN